MDSFIESAEPLWAQVAAHVRERIDQGEWPPGSRLPAERELCESLDVSRVTLRKALAALVDEGILNSSHGRGWYVEVTEPRQSSKEWPSSLESFSETARRMGLPASSQVLDQRVSPATLDEAEELSLAPGTPLFRLRRIRLLDGVPIALDSTQVPASLLGDSVTADFATASLYVVLVEAGVGIARAEAVVEAQEADDELAQALDLSPGRPVLLMRQLAYDEGGRPIFVSSIRYAGDRYRLRTSFMRQRR